MTLLPILTAASLIIAVALAVNLAASIQHRRKVKARRERMKAIAKVRAMNWSY